MAGSKSNQNLGASLEGIIKGIPRGVHPTAAEVYRRAREEGIDVSLSTVYRTLHQLQAHGHVRRLAGEHGNRYESSDADHDHDHLICIKCGLTIEFEDDLIRGFGKTVAERKDYEYRSSRFDILGVCGQCKAQGEDHKIESALDAIARIQGLQNQLSAHRKESGELFSTRRFARGKDALESAMNLIEEMLETLEPTLNLLKQTAQES